MSICEAAAILVGVFQKYSGVEGDKFTLSKAELRTLLKAEMGFDESTAKDQKALGKFMDELDQDKDEVVDFKEYMILVTSVIMMFNEFFKES